MDGREPSPPEIPDAVADAMILCVTLNPCLDKTLTVPHWRPGDLVRGTVVREVVGGKGNNVARALKRLARHACPVTFLGGVIGSYCETLLRADDGLEPLVVASGTATRVIVTVRTGETDEQTAFFDPNPEILPNEAEALARVVDEGLATGHVEALTLSGSSPASATHGLYCDLIALARARRVPVFLDTYGPALDAVWGIWPTAMQLNRREAAAHLRKPAVSDADVAGLLQKWAKHGVVCGVVTDGRHPVDILYQGRRYRAIPPHIKPVNPIGSGDSLLAGLVAGWLAAMEPERLFRHAIACAVANAMIWDAGAIDPADVAKWEEHVVVEPA
ncbi:MAG: 1-phosphofructokinase family hexose kinase [Isosphaeraceae bacterium]